VVHDGYANKYFRTIGDKMKRFNINKLIWFIILVLFTYYVHNLFNTGKISMYIHPKMFKYVLFSFNVSKVKIIEPPKDQYVYL